MMNMIVNMTYDGEHDNFHSDECHACGGSDKYEASEKCDKHGWGYTKMMTTLAMGRSS